MSRVHWAAGAIALLTVSTGLVFSAPPAKTTEAEPKKPPVKFTVASYNINYGNPDLREVEKAIVKADADLLCLQETNRSSEAYLRRRLGRKYRYHSFIRAPRHAAGGYGFMSKVPLRNVKYLPKHKGMFGTYLAEVTLAGKKVQVASLHLQPMFFGRNRTLGEYWRELKQYEQIHAAEIAFIWGKLSKTLPLLIVGDLNSPSMMYAPQYLRSRGLVDSFASVTDKPDEYVTWHWRTGRVNWQYRLDYIFHSKQIRTLSSAVVRTGGSDHYLLTSSLTWAPAKATTRPTGPGQIRSKSE